MDIFATGEYPAAPPCGFLSFLSFGDVGFGFELGPARLWRSRMPVHIPRPKIDKLVCQTQDVGIFTLCVNTRLTLASVPFVLEGQSPNFETVLQTVGVAESGSHIPLGDRRARSPGIECGYLRHRRIPGHINTLMESHTRSLFSLFGNFSFDFIL